MSPQTGAQLVKQPTEMKPSTGGDPLDRIQQTYDSIARRAFELFENNGGWFGREWEDWFRAEAELLHPVHLEVAESNDALTVRAEVPGFGPKELDISVEPRRLVISGKQQAQENSRNGKTIYSERCAKEILRVVNLPADVESSKASATLENGVLQIELPKSPRAKAVRIEPKTV